MRHVVLFSLVVLGAGGTAFSSAQFHPEPKDILSTYITPTNSAGLLTNGPAVFRVLQHEKVTVSVNPEYERKQRLLESSNRLPAAVYERLMRFPEPKTATNVVLFTNLVFHSYAPESLNQLVWTNFVEWTNGRSMARWSTRKHTARWPRTAPVVEWNRKSLVYGLRGFTALSPCWEREGSCGQVPVTAITRRHGYTRGHGMGIAGHRNHYAGKKVWFLSASGKTVEARVRREIVRVEEGRDYTILLFDRDLPESITPLRVANAYEFQKHYPHIHPAPWPVFYAEQHGHISTGVPGLTYPIYKGGDSGSPNLIPLPGELVFIGGRSTSSPDARMQADLDELSRKEGLDPRKYQMEWVDLSRFPQY